MTTTSPRLKPEAIAFEAFAADIALRRTAAGEVEVPRNSGERRTEEKRSLLAAIGRTGARW